MKRCPGCGYAHFEAGAANLSEVCDRCGTALDVRIDGLVAMQNVTVREAQRITCDEEERQRFGYRLVTAYRFPEVNGQLDRKDAEVYRGDARILKLSYGDATDLYRVNLGWANQAASQPPGFKPRSGARLLGAQPGRRRRPGRRGHRNADAARRTPTCATPKTCW